MRFPPFYAVLICAGLMATPSYLSAQTAPATATNAADTNALGPRMTFAAKEYQFGKVTAGTLVKHVFIVTNTGDQTLAISNVQPGCHCTTAGNWTHQIEPGKTGEIPIQFDSGSFHGDVTKNITVTSNDKLAPMQTISLHGTIWRAFELRPQFAYITVPPDASSNVTTIVHISSQSDEPVTLSDPTSANGAFKADLKIIKPGKEFEVSITAVPPLAPGNNPGTISLKTSLTNTPEITITVIAMMQSAISVAPMQLFLPPQIDAWRTNVVSIINNGTNALAVSDPESSDKRILVELKETDPGRVFQLTAIFPPGFQVAPGQTAQLSVKSNKAQSPVIVVPIRQFPPQPGVSRSLALPKVMSQNPPVPPAAGHP